MANSDIGRDCYDGKIIYTLFLEAANSESKEGPDFISSSSTWTKLFRFLRNEAASSSERQDDIAKKADLLDLAIKRIYSLLERMQSDSLVVPERADVSIELRCGIQFLGNLVTNNESNKFLIWPRLSSTFTSLLTWENDTPLLKAATMLFYNCIIAVPVLRDEFLCGHREMHTILSLLLRSATNNNSEWGLFAFEYFLQSPSFMKNCYDALPTNQRLFILDIIISMMNDKDERPVLIERSIAFENIQCAAHALENRADVVFRTDLMTSPEDHLEVIRLAEVLCAVSSNDIYNQQLAKRSSLLCCTLFLLKGIHMADNAITIGHESANVSHSTDHIGNASNDVQRSGHAIDGLKCTLIRLVANMSWHNRANQDKVREFDGIPLLLDCCKLDAKNPYITQWVVYAIRNLCQDNVENQQLIASMEKQGQVAMPSGSFIQVVTDEQGNNKSPASRVHNETPCEPSFQDQAKEDILDLFT